MAGQGSTASAADTSEMSEAALVTVKEEIPGAMGWSEIRGDGTLCGRRWRFSGDALFEFEVRFGLAEALPVRHQLRRVVPGGRSARGSARRLQLYGT